MRIVFDSQAFRMQQHGGISRYIVWLARALQAQHDDVRVVAPLHRNVYLSDANDLSRFAVSASNWHVPRRIEGALNRLVEPLALAVSNPDILHATFYKDTPRFGAKARVLTVHDMIHERFSHWHPDSPAMAMKARAVKKADHIICISKTTQTDLCELLDVPISKTSVIYHGGSQLPDHRQGAGPLYGGRPYILFVGQRYRHKNFEVVLDAFGASQSIRQNFQLVAFGGSPFTELELERAKRAGIRPADLIQLSGDDQALVEHYKQAAVFVYPSLYEGFGMPLLEAMALGCPVVTSNVSCMPEIAGDAALYFDPTEPVALAEALDSLVSNEKIRRRMISLGREQEQRFSWIECAKLTKQSYNSAIAR